MEDILNLNQHEEIDEETAENGMKTLSMPVLINDVPMQEGKEENKKKKRGSKNKKPSVVRRQKMIRGNRRLRKAIQPRNALMALNEIKGLKIENVDSYPDSGKIKAIVTINGKEYAAHDTTSKAAKNAACEKALSDFMTYKLKAKPLDGGDELTNDPEDDKSILNLASFAIHKLFSEWERNGLPIPSVLSPQIDKADTADGFDRSELPNGWEKMHPVSVLLLMRPNVSLLDVEGADDLQEGHKCVRITVGTRSFTASGSSKKKARRMVAIAACNALFGTNFNETDTI